MSSHRRPWFPWYPKDYVADEKTRGLSDDADLLYRRVLDIIWQANALQLPNNCIKLALQIARGWSKERFENAWNEIQTPGFELLKTAECGQWVYSQRLLNEAQKIENISKIRSESGRKAKAKQKLSKSQAKAKQKPNHTHTHTDTHKDINTLSIHTEYDGDTESDCREIINHLNKSTNKDFSIHHPNYQRLIYNILRSGRTVDDIKCVIDHKRLGWEGKLASDGEPMDRFMRPETLFGEKFESYLQEIPYAKEEAAK